MKPKQVLCSVTFYENRAVCEIMRIKYCRARHATDENMTHAHSTLDTYGIKHTTRICDTYWFSPATMVTRKGRAITLYVYCLCCIRSVFRLW